jgi:hypothetical protein
MVELSVVGAPVVLPGPGGSGIEKSLSPGDESGPAAVPGPERLCCSRVVVAGGGRDLIWPRARVAAALLGASGGRPVHLLLHGDARGADQSIDRAARQLGWAVQAVPADWPRLGRAAGPIRNRQLLRRALLAAQSLSSPGYPASVLVVAFPGGRGTASLVQLAREMQKSQEQAAQLERAPAVAVVEITGADGAFSPVPQR